MIFGDWKNWKELEKIGKKFQSFKINNLACKNQ